MNQKEILAAYKAGKLSIDQVRQKLVEIQTARDIYPLSEGQKGFWFLYKMAPDNSAYNLPLCFRFVKDVDVEALKKAILFAREQFPILKTVIHSEQGIPVQIIDPLQPFVVNQEDISSQDRSSQLSYLKKKVKAPFILEQGPLMRADIFKCSAQEHILLITVHHIVFDGVSMMNYQSTLFNAYAGLLDPIAPGASYKDFVMWEEKLLKSDEGTKHLNYWKKQLSSPLPVLELPTDFPRPSQQTFKGETVSKELSSDLLLKIKALAVSHHVQPSVAFLAIFKVLLARYTGQEDLIIGMPTLGRPEERFQSVMGYFINMLPLRSRVKGPFANFMKQLQMTLADALDHGVYPFPALMKELEIDRTQTSAPIFQAAFIYQNFFNSRAGNSLGVEQVEEIRQEGEFELSLEVYEKGDQAVFNLLYNPDLFQSATIEQMMNHYIKLIGEITDSPHLPIEKYQLLSFDEQNKLIKTLNATERDYPQTKCIHDFFEERVQQAPDAIAVISEERSLTFQELSQKSTDLARYLQKQGVCPETLVGICVERSLEMVIGVLGILKAGGAYVPLDPNCPQHQLDQMLEDSNTPIIVTQSKFKGLFKKKQLLLLDTSWASDSETPVRQLVTPNHLAYVIYTSGSTGKPKGVMVEHRSIVNTLCFLEEKYPVAKGDAYLLKTNYVFDVSLSELFGWFIGKGHLVVLPPGLEKSPQSFKSYIEKHKITHINFVPSLLNVFLNDYKFAESCPIKYLMVAGEAFPKSLVEKAVRVFKNGSVENIYGPTEAAIYATWYCCSDHEAADYHTPIGKPVANTQIYILDRHLQPMPIGLSGELFIAGNGLARGYWNNPELTAEKFIDNPFTPGTKFYKTGDLARWLPNGQIEYLGRLDHQVKIRGFRIELGAIESHIGTHPKVSENVTIVKRDGNHKKLVAYYVVNANLTADELRSYLHSRLPEYMVPAHFIQLDKLPLTPNGKVDRKELEKREIISQTAEKLPQSEIEGKILSIWRDILNVKDIGLQDGFFDLGGDSLLAITLMERISQEFSCEIGVTELFGYPNIHTLSRYIAKQKQVQTASKQSVESPDYYKDSVAIIGISCHFPGAKNLKEFWHNLQNGKESVQFFTKKELADLGISKRLIENPKYIPAQSSIEGKDLFDPEFFQLSPKDAEMMDPQLRLLLLHSWKAIEDAGYIPKKIPDTSVFMSASNNSYQALLSEGDEEVLESSDAYIAWVLAQSGTIPTMISHKLGLKGPSYFVHSNCSSSLVGLYNAYQSLKSNKSSYALVGATTLHVLSNVGYVYQNGLNLSSDGHIKAFDAAADGMIGGEGVAVILLKNACEAVRDGDHIYSILRGIEINNDGAEKVGFYAPSIQGQAAVIEKVLQSTGVDPETITYVEAHGTGTKIGDPIELSAISQAYQNYTDKKQFCGIGSVKTNIGHLDTASGLAGCIKVALSLYNNELVPTINYKNPNPKLNLEKTPFFIVNKNKSLETDKIHRGALSSFGVGGTNVHAIFEQYLPEQKSQLSKGPFLIPVSAKNKERLVAYIQQLLANLGTEQLENVAFTLQYGREPMETRAIFSANSIDELKEKLEKYLRGEKEGLELHGLAKLWMQGEEVNWDALYPNGKPDRISLPTYPFAQKRFWPKLKKREQQQTSKIHPMVHQNTSTLSQSRFSSTFTGEEYFIAEHIIKGATIVPAVVTLEMARAAILQGIGEDVVITLKNVVWIRPIVVDKEPVQVHIALFSEEKDQIRYQMYSDQTIYNQGLGELCEMGDEVIIDLSTIQKQCNHEKILSQQFYEGMIGADYGPSYKAIREVYLGEDQLIAKLSLPNSAIDAENSYILHPSTMDGVFQVAEYLQNIARFKAFSAEGKVFQAAVPFALEKIEILKPTLSEMWVHVKFSGKEKVDIDLCDNNGVIHVRIKGFSIRAIEEEEGTLLCFKPDWKRKEIDKELNLVYAQQLTCFFEIEGSEIYSFDERPAPIEKRFENYCTILLEKIQSILQTSPKEPVLIQIVIPHQNEQQLFSAFAGLLKTAKLENSRLVGQIIEVDSSKGIFEKLKENKEKSLDQHIRYREGERYVFDWKEVTEQSSSGSIPWKEDGVYLITGGAGGLGQIFANEIAFRAKNASIILAGRSPLNKAPLPQIVYKQADVADKDAVDRLIKEILKEYGRLDGIIHAAGIIRDNYIHKKTKEELHEVLAPKVKGLVNLDEATKGIHLDFFILFSSTSGSMGSAGQADYAAANAFMDAYAVYRNQLAGRFGRTLSINWPLWKEGGMRVDASNEKMLSQTLGILPMVTEKGIQALYRAWNLDVDQTMMLYGQNIKQKLAQSIKEKTPNITEVIYDNVDESVTNYLRSEISKLLKVKNEDIDDRAQMTKYGLESISMIELINTLNQKFRFALTPTIFFEYPTIEDFARYLVKEHQRDLAPHFAAYSNNASSPKQLKKELIPKQNPVQKQKDIKTSDAIAIIGISGVFPMAKDVEEFWENLEQGKDCISEIPGDRWNWRDYEGDPVKEVNKTQVRWGGFIHSLAEFDPLFFGISPREAELMDPQQRLALTYVWKALEDAGYSAKSISGTNTAVFLGTGNTGYSALVAKENSAVDGSAAANMSPSAGPNRISYLLNIHGPSEPIDTACSSSLVAIHHAIAALQDGSCKMAIAGGINTILLPEVYIAFDKAGALSKEGKCKTFSDKADGFAHGEGAGILVLKNLKQAEQDGDHIYGSIQSSFVNHGGHAASLTTPNPKAQAELIIAAYKKAEIDPRTVTYIEAHGTGTELGDPVEINGLKLAFKNSSNSENFNPSCGLGSVKTNIGHLSLAAGAASVIKVLLQLKYKTLVKSLHCETINPYIQLKDSPFYIVQEKQPWKTLKDEQGKALPRRAGVSSFGIGGVNAHVVIEEYIAKEKDDFIANTPAVILLSAKNEKQLKAQVQQFVDAIEKKKWSSNDLANIAYTLQVGRDAMEIRLGLIVSSLEELEEKLRAFLQDSTQDFYKGKVDKGSLQKLLSGEEIEEAIEKWMLRRKYSKLLELWVRGLDVDWKKLYSDHLPTRISLPTYPFATDHYWIEKKSSNAPRYSSFILHPLVHQNTSSLFEQRFSSTFNGEEFFLKEHVIKGQAVLPGVAHLEMARFALELALEKTEQTIIKLKDIVWIRPIALEHPSIDINIRIYPKDTNEVAFEIYRNESIAYSQGNGILAPLTDIPQIDLASLKAKCTPSGFSADEVDQIYQKIGFSYGPSFRALKEIYLGENCVLAKVALPLERSPYSLHPGMMDSALQASSLLVGTQENRLMLPFALEEIEIYKKCTFTMWVYAQLGEQTSERIQRRNIDLCDELGQVCIRIKGLSFRALESAAQPSTKTSIFEPLWIEKEEIEEIEYANRVVFACEINGIDKYSNAEVYLLDERPSSIENRFVRYASQLFEKVQNILRRGVKDKILIQLVVSSSGEGRLFTGLFGLLKSAKLENSNLIVQCIESNMPDRLTEGEDEQIRYLGERRFVLDWKEKAESDQMIPWKENGVYLISGGAGGLGLIFAQEMARKNCSVILIGRSPVKAFKVGPKVVYKQTDVTDKNAVRQLIKDIQEEYGHLNGIIHAAGITRDNYILKKTEEELQQVLAPKVAGLVNLDEATQDIQLDFLVLFSSAAASMGSAGQADYSMANAFLDAYSEYRNELTAAKRRYGITLSINWPLWKEGGMHVDPQTERMLLQNRGIVPMGTENGLQAFYRSINSKKDKVLVIERVLQQQAAPPPARKVALGEEKVLLAITGDVSKLLKIKIDDIDIDNEFQQYGFDSITLTELANLLNEQYSFKLTPTIFFEYPTLRKFAEYLTKTYQNLLADQFTPNPIIEEEKEKISTPIQPRGLRFLQSEPHSFQEQRYQGNQPVAIVGISGVFPMATDLDDFWKNLEEGKDCITEIPQDRWDWREYYGDPTKEANKTNVKWGGFIDSVAEFDPLFFGISPKEAETMDPQQRLALTYVWKAMEDAGYSSQSISGTNTAVFLGIGNTGYSALLARSKVGIEGTTAANMSPSVGPNRISYFLNLHGPSEPIDTACSSSLVAIHHAIEALQDPACELAIAGGVNTVVAPEGHIAFDKAGALSKEGRCKTFSDRADGFAVGEGAGIFLLKTLKNAELAGDHIYGVIRSSAINHGGRANSLTTPNPNAQAKLLVAAYSKADIDPSTVTYIEAHGTGTELGDPVEINGLKAAFKGAKNIKNSCGLGSVKTNIGHLSLAAGAASLIKVLLQLKHKKLVKTIHCDRINPYIDLEDTPFYIVRENQEWKSLKDAQGKILPRRAGISSFGIGGVNAHIVVEEYIEKEKSQLRDPNQQTIIVLSAKNKARLEEQAEQLLIALRKKKFTDADLPRIAYTLQIGRDPMEERLSFIVTSLDQLERKLQAFLEKEKAIEDLYKGRVERGAFQKFLADEEIQEAISKWILRKKYNKLIELWVKGLNIDWSKLYGENKPKKIALPTYPFAKERYWVEAEEPKTDFSKIYNRTFVGDEFFLTDHQINGKKILPAVVYLEMVRDALARRLQNNQAQIRIKNVAWIQPLIVDNDPVVAHIAFSEEENGDFSYEIYSESEEKRVLHSQGRACLFDGEMPYLDLNNCYAKCEQKTLSSSECYEVFRTLGVNYGPSLQGIEKLQIGKGEVLAELTISNPDRGFILHPSIMDSALQASLGLKFGSNTQEFSLPFALEELEIFGPCEPHMWAYISSSEQGKMEKIDIDLCDDQGCVRVRFKKISSRIMKKSESAQNILLTPIWAPAVFTTGVQDCENEPILLIGENFEKPYPKTKVLEIQPQDTIEEIAQKMEPFSPIREIVWIASQPSGNIIADQQKGVIQLFRIIKALLLLGYGDKKLKWTIATAQTQSVLANDIVSPSHASVHGLIGSMAKEYSNWKVRLVDMEIRQDYTLSDLFTVPFDADGDAYAYRNQKWYKQKLVPAKYMHPTAEHGTYRQGGVYVIIGGAGGIGQVWSEHLIRTCKAQVIWIGRKKANREIQEKIEHLATLGPSPIYIEADATDKKALQEAYEKIKRIYPQIHGVIHSAIVLMDQSLMNMDEEVFKKALSAKVDVSVRIAQVFHKEQLDFVLFFSSMQSFAKAAGQSNYAAGCTFKDAFAHRLAHEWPCAVRVMNWGYWGNVGIVSSAQYRERMAQAGIGSIESAEAMEALELLLAGPLNQLVLIKTISPNLGMDIDEFIQIYPENEKSNIEKLQLI